MRYGLYDIYCSAHYNQCSLIIRSFWLHGVVGADLRPDNNRRSTVEEPHDTIRLSIIRAKDYAEAEKRSRNSPASGGGGEVAELMKVVTLGLLKQIAEGQQTQTNACNLAGVGAI